MINKKHAGRPPIYTEARVRKFIEVNAADHAALVTHLRAKGETFTGWINRKMAEDVSSLLLSRPNSQPTPQTMAALGENDIEKVSEIYNLDPIRLRHEWKMKLLAEKSRPNSYVGRIIDQKAALERLAMQLTTKKPTKQEEEYFENIRWLIKAESILGRKPNPTERKRIMSGEVPRKNVIDGGKEVVVWTVKKFA